MDGTKGIEHCGILSAPPGRDLLYHYTDFGAARKILQSQTFLMNPYSRMRDPLENRALPRLLRYHPDSTTENLLPIEEARSTLAELRGQMRILSFTSDVSGYDAPSEVLFGKGYARPRMWETYADIHRGVCFVLDAQSVAEGWMRGQLQSIGGTNISPVKYSPTGFIGDPVVTLPDIPDDDRAAEALCNHLDLHNEAFWFLKLCDWNTEFEYRLVVFPENVADDEPVFVNIGQALKAVVVGALVPKEGLAEMDELCEPNGVGVHQLDWRSGRPSLVTR